MMTGHQNLHFASYITHYVTKGDTDWATAAFYLNEARSFFRGYAVSALRTPGSDTTYESHHRAVCIRWRPAV